MNSKAFHLDSVRDLSNHPQELVRLLQPLICNTEVEIIMNLAGFLQHRVFM